MHPPALRRLARARVAAGETTVAVAADLGVAQRTVWRWAHTTLADDAEPGCPVCGAGHFAPAAYTYLLGQYLGDGHLVSRARVPVLRIYACTDFPAVLDDLCRAVLDVRGRQAGIARASDTDRMVKVQSYWTHWPCLFPQHGPGRKHERPIVLAEWQRALVADHPWDLLRGLFHSDGCRCTNRVAVRGRAYEYPRWLFANESRDILGLCAATLDTVGVAWRYNRPNSLSVARRAAVASLDRGIGVKQ